MLQKGFHRDLSRWHVWTGHAGGSCLGRIDASASIFNLIEASGPSTKIEGRDGKAQWFKAGNSSAMFGMEGRERNSAIALGCPELPLPHGGKSRDT